WSGKQNKGRSSFAESPGHRTRRRGGRKRFPGLLSCLPSGARLPGTGPDAGRIRRTHEGRPVRVGGQASSSLDRAPPGRTVCAPGTVSRRSPAERARGGKVSRTVFPLPVPPVIRAGTLLARRKLMHPSPPTQNGGLESTPPTADLAEGV